MKKAIFSTFLFAVLFQGDINAQIQNYFEDIFLERIWLSVSNLNGSYNETLIAFKPDATLGIDTAYDAEKLIGSENLSFYSKIGSGKYAIQALPSLFFDIDVPLGIEASVDDVYTLAIAEEVNFTVGAQLIVEDTKTGIFHNLRNEQNFSFQFDHQLDTLRFIAHFKPAPQYGALSGSCLLNDGVIYISNPSETSWNVSIFDLDSTLIINNVAVDSFMQWTQFVAGFYYISFRNEYDAMYNVAIQIESALPVEMQISASSNLVNISNATVDFTALLSGAEEIFWDFGDGSFDTSQTQISHTYNSPGIYTVTAVAGSPGCEQFDSEIITVNGVITALEIDTEVISTSINGNILLTFNKSIQPQILEIFDISGKRLQTKTLNALQQNIEIDCSSLLNQLILIRVIGQSGEFNAKYFCN